MDVRRENLIPRFLVVGAMNTGFGYSLFAALNYLFRDSPYGYLAATLLGNVIAITVAFVNYKFLVFRTRGGYLREYLKFYLVYGLSIAAGLIFMPLLVEVLGMNSYLAAAALLPMTVALSYVGHSRFSFHNGARHPQEKKQSA